MRYAIADIHGCPETFRALLAEIDLNRNDELFLLGDYINRGPDSQGVIDTIWKLADEGFNVTCLMGNHEEMLLQSLRGERPLHEWQPVGTNRERVAKWMNELLHYVETPGYFLVHAGLNFTSKSPLEDTASMLWIRDFYDTLDRRWLGERILVHGHNPAPLPEVRRAIKNMTVNQYVFIDSGCSHNEEGMGYLTALNLDTGAGTFVGRRD